MLKEEFRTSHDTRIWYSGLKDYFGNKMYVVIDTILKEIRLYSKNKDFKKERKRLDNAGHTNVYTPKYGEVIDISKATLREIKKYFQEYQLPLYKWQVWD